MMRRLLLLLPVLFGLAVGPLAGAALAAPGDLDPTFGAGGIALTSPDSGLDKATAMGVQWDGGYVVAGTHTDGTTFAQTCAIVRFLSDGSLDPTFGTSWGPGVHAPSVVEDWAVSQVLVDGQGRIYCLGHPASSTFPYSVVRLLSDGQVDASFGDAGVVVLQSGAVQPGWALRCYISLCQGGGLLVAETVYDLIHLNDIAVVHLLESGSPDAAFGIGGLFRIDIANGSDDTPTGISSAANGDILVGGVVGWRDTLLLRLTPSGARSLTFGSNGLAVIPSWATPGATHAMFERPDGSILLSSGSQLKRVSIGGVVDTAFGADGTVTLLGAASGFTSGFALSARLVQPDGAILSAGTIDNGYPTYKDVLVARNLPDGSVDTGFGAGGQVVTDLGGADDCTTAGLDPSGKLVVAGYAYPSGSAPAGQKESSRLATTIFGMGLIRYLCGPSSVVPVARVKSAVTRLSPTSGKRGATVVIAGKDFGGRRTTSYVKFGATKVGKYVSWSKTRIRCRVPAKAKFGRLKVVVVTPAGAGSARTFTVKR